MVPLLVTFSSLAMQVLIAFSFYYAGLSGVNSGIIASIFSTSALFSPLIFYAQYGQKLSRNDALGCLFIIGSVFIIGTSGGSSAETDIESTNYLLMSVLFALGVGLLMSLYSLMIQWSTKTVGYPPSQIFYDGNILFGVIVLICFIIDQS